MSLWAVLAVLALALAGPAIAEPIIKDCGKCGNLHQPPCPPGTCGDPYNIDLCRFFTIVQPYVTLANNAKCESCPFFSQKNQVCYFRSASLAPGDTTCAPPLPGFRLDAVLLGLGDDAGQAVSQCDFFCPTVGAFVNEVAFIRNDQCRIVFFRYFTCSDGKRVTLNKTLSFYDAPGSSITQSFPDGLNGVTLDDSQLYFYDSEVCIPDYNYYETEPTFVGCPEGTRIVGIRLRAYRLPDPICATV